MTSNFICHRSEDTARGAEEGSDENTVDLSIPVGMQSGAAAARYPRGYEIITTKPVQLQAVKVKMKLSEGSIGAGLVVGAEMPGLN